MSWFMLYMRVLNFSKLDLSEDFDQMELDQDRRKK